jgi:hypothetical protein
MLILRLFRLKTVRAPQRKLRFSFPSMGGKGGGENDMLGKYNKTKRT